MKTINFETFIANLWQRIPKHIKVTFFATIIIGVLVHIFMMTNKLPNHDDLSQLYGNAHYPAIGRWFSIVPAELSGKWSVPWLNGMLAFVYAGLAACLTVSCLNIRQTLNCILVAGLMVSTPVLTNTFGYLQLVDAYMFGLLLASLSIYLTNNYKYGSIVGALCIVLSLGIYQAFFPYAAGLAVAVLIIDILNGKTEKETIVKATKLFAVLLVGLLSYIIYSKYLMPTELAVTYQGASEMGNIDLASIPQKLIDAYFNGLTHFYAIHGNGLLVIRYTYVIMAILGLVMLAMVIKQKKLYKSLLRFLLLLLLIVTLPLAVNLIYFMTDMDLHIVMLYPSILILIALIAVSETFSNVKQGLCTIVLLCVFCLCNILHIYNFTLMANQAYLKLFFTYEHAYAYGNRLVSRIESAPGYSSSYKILFIGRPTISNESFPELSRVSVNFVGISPANWFFIPTRANRTNRFLARYLAFSNLPSHINAYENIPAKYLDQINSMPSYPDDGSIQIIDNIVIVKFLRS